MVEPAMSKRRRRSFIDTVVPMRRQAGWLTTLYEDDAGPAGPAHLWFLKTSSVAEVLAFPASAR